MFGTDDIYLSRINESDNHDDYDPRWDYINDRPHFINRDLFEVQISRVIDALTNIGEMQYMDLRLYHGGRDNVLAGLVAEGVIVLREVGDEKDYGSGYNKFYSLAEVKIEQEQK